MDRSRVGSAAYQAVKRIHLTHKVPFTQPTDCRIAAHRAKFVGIESHQSCANTHARGNSRSFAAGVSAAHNDDIKLGHGPQIMLFA